MSTLKELTKVLDDYLVDYAHPVDWTKFRRSLREIREVLKGLAVTDDNLVEKMLDVGKEFCEERDRLHKDCPSFEASPSGYKRNGLDLIENEMEAKAEISKLLQGRK